MRLMLGIRSGEVIISVSILTLYHTERSNARGNFWVIDLELESTIFETDVAVHDRLQWLFYIICLQKKFVCYTISARAGKAAGSVTGAQPPARKGLAQLQAHYASVTGNVPAGYIPLATLDKAVKAHKATIPGLTIAKMVKAIGGDRALQPPVNPICKPVP